MDTIDSAMYLRFSCRKIAPFGFPVVPEEYLKVAISPKLTGEVIDPASLGALERKSIQEIIFFDPFWGKSPRQKEITGISIWSSSISFAEGWVCQRTTV